MPSEIQAPRTKKIHHKEKGLRMPVQDSFNSDPRPPKKRKRDEPETEMVAIEDKNERKRRKKEEKARQRAPEEDIQLISPVQKLGPAVISTLEGESKKAKTRKDEDARKVEDLLAMVTETKKSKKKKRKKKKKKPATFGQSAEELHVGPVQESANETNKDRSGPEKVKPVAESAKNEVTKTSPNDHEDEWEVEESLNVSSPPQPDALVITRDTADEDTLRAVVIGPSQPAPGGIVSGTGPAQRRAARVGGEKHTSDATAIVLGPEAQLASRWLSSAEVKQLEQDTGIVVKKGKFTTSEEVAIRGALDSFRVANTLSHEDVVNIIINEKRAKYNRLWHDLAAAVPLRPLAAVYSHCKRVYHPLARQGKWTEEEDERLLTAVDEVGHNWEKVSTHVGRFATDCRDRYKNHLSERDKRNTGPWTEEEKEELIRVVREVQEDQGKDSDDNDDILWSIVSARMGKRRGRQQVRDKWLNQLRARVQNETEKLRWTKQDSVILLRRLASLKIEDESEINWNALSDGDLNLWSAHNLQRHWTKMKKGVKGHQDRTFLEILKMVTVKNGTKLSEGTKARRDSTSKKGAWGEDKELTLSKNIIKDSDEELAELDDESKTALIA